MVMAAHNIYDGLSTTVTKTAFEMEKRRWPQINLQLVQHCARLRGISRFSDCPRKHKSERWDGC